MNTTNPWVTFGCSYAGALAAWFRLKYPHLTVGSISSSGVVNAVLDFYEFDQQVAKSVGKECANVLRKITKQLEALLEESEESNQQTKALFQAYNFTDGDFYWLVADIAAESVQYGYQTLLCNSVMGVPDDGLVTAYVNFSINFYYPVFIEPDTLWNSYSSYGLQDESTSNGDRTWWWQECSELGYFQNAPAQDSIRSHNVNMTYHRWRCNTAFGNNVWPNTIQTNNHYGGANIRGTSIYFINSSQDPWQWAGVRQPIDWQEPADIVYCEDCGHCSDIRGCPSLPGLNEINGCAEPNNVDMIRLKTADFIAYLLDTKY